MNDVQANAAALTVGIVPPAPATGDYQASIVKAPRLQSHLRFDAPDGKYGKLWFDENGCFQFEGDASASAQVLFDEMKRLSGK
jgi:hypothetical protein